MQFLLLMVLFDDFTVVGDARDLWEQYQLYDKNQPVDKTFERNPKLDDVLENAMGIWFRYKAEPFEVRLSVTPEIAKFFRRKPLSKTQVISSVGIDGSMEITVKITHEMEIIPIVQYWMPNMRVIEPQWIHEQIMENINGYS